MQIKAKCKNVETIVYMVTFDTDDDSGYGFECDQDGDVNLSQLTPLFREILNRCLAGEYGPGEIRPYRKMYTEAAVGICDNCGQDVVLAAHTNTCECGMIYNMSGLQLLSHCY
jgi:hypothetical protein